jgi:membrane protease YdiL (CAAX protease family)
LVGGLLVGIPFTLAACCLNKAIEISVMLRCSSRVRGGVLGLISCVGFIAAMLTIMAIGLRESLEKLVPLVGKYGQWIPSFPTHALILGWSNTPVLWQAVLIGICLAAIILSSSVAIAWWGLQRGLQGSSNPQSQTMVWSASERKPRLLEKFPLYRKELLWFSRDSGAIVQAILLPLILASLQLINFRSLLEHASSRWNAMSGSAVIVGTYFLMVLGPRSLISEGAALWMATTWPQGMEALLRAKARLWWILSCVIVGLILMVTAIMFPADLWKIGLVAIGWSLFSYGLATKTVTLTRATSSSGETEPVSQGARWVVMMGTLTFGFGVMSQSWTLAITGVVFLSLTSAAIWQNFRARLPFLFDPWSEKLPPAPTLMHAMVAIGVMIELVGISSAIALGLGGAASLWKTRAIAYGIVGLLTWFGTQHFLKGRSVSNQAIWTWPQAAEISRPRWQLYSGAILGGLTLAGFALLYLAALRAMPLTREMMLAMDQSVGENNNWKIWALILAVGFAPFAEEYLFRGLLFRALDREWGGYAALIGSSAYFMIYHPPVSWLPVFIVGLANAWLFKKCGSLTPCVLLHLSYNAVVVGLS